MKLPAFILISLSAVLCACASSIPRAITEQPDTRISLTQARGGMAQLSGQSVRWGGKIAGVENHSTETWIEIVQQPLNHFGRPLEGDASEGRFIARIEGFLDPQVYSKDRLITVAGTLEKTIQRPIGEYPYTAEPQQGQGCYVFGDGAGGVVRLGFRHGHGLHEVEVVQQADPDNAGEDVKPTVKYEIHHFAPKVFFI